MARAEKLERDPAAGIRRRLTRQLSAGTRSSRVSLDGIALMFSTAATAGSSLLFWVVAARTDPTDAVGRASSEIAAFTMLAGFAQLNLLSVFIRFLAGAGNRVLRFLSTGYVAIIAAALVLGSAFVTLGLGSGFFIDASWWEYATFIVAVPVFAVFVVQDGVLTSFSKAPWVPVENLAVAVVRLGLLAILGSGFSHSSTAGDRFAVIGAWAVPTTAAVGVVSWLIFRRLAPEALRRSPDASALPDRRELSSFVVAQYLNNSLNNVVTYVPPLLILHLLGPTAAAYINVPWLIVVSTQTLLWNIGMSFIAEVTRRPEGMATHVRQTLRLGGVVVAGWTVALLAGAPLLLGLQGHEFAAQGVGLLRLLALSFPFTGVVILYSFFASLEQRLWRLLGVNAAGTAAFVAAMLTAVPGAGIVSVGWAYLAVQAGLALFLLPPVVARIRRGAISLPEEASRAAAAAESATGVAESTAGAAESTAGAAESTAGAAEIGG